MSTPDIEEAIVPFEPMPQAKTLSVMPTWQCTAECEHCGTLSSPREKTRLPAHSALKAIDEAAGAGYRVVVFTGGEPTLGGKKLLEWIAHASGLGLVTRIVTNAFWATSEAAADRKMAELVAAGLVEINFSTGDEHVRFVPIENVIRGARAAARTGMNVSIMIERTRDRRLTRSDLETHADFLRLRADHPNALLNIVESPWMPLSASEISAYQEGQAANRSNLAARQGCNDILTTTTIEADGSIAACCGIGMRNIPELRLGNVRDIGVAEADRKANDDFLKRWIRIEGPERILAWAAEIEPDIQWENMYAHRCQACVRLYTDPQVRGVIRAHYQKKIPGVLFGEWLLYHYRPERLATSQAP